jgi:hypothetical protein
MSSNEASPQTAENALRPVSESSFLGGRRAAAKTASKAAAAQLASIRRKVALEDV